MSYRALIELRNKTHTSYYTVRHPEYEEMTTAADTFAESLKGGIEDLSGCVELRNFTADEARDYLKHYADRHIVVHE